MVKPRVFISHSARDDANALKLLFALDERLKGEQFDVQLDRKCLEVGDSWEHKIGTWLDSCHAAIVLFTATALRSDYVKFEVSNLLHRWHRSGGAAGTFLLLPVLVEPLTDDQLRDFYSAIQLWTVQRMGPAADNVIIDALVDKLAPLKVGGLKQEDELDARVTGHVAAVLDHVAEDKYLVDLADQLGADTIDWPRHELRSQFASLLISSSIATRWDAIRYLAPRLEIARVRKLFGLLMPCWVGSEAARKLNTITKAIPGPRCAFLNARALPFTPTMYLVRAKSQPELAGDVVDIRTDDLEKDLEAALTARIRAVLKDRLHVDESDPDYPETLAEVLRKRNDDQPVIVAMKADARVAAVIPRIATNEDLQKATFLALIDPASAATPAGLAPVDPLLPDTLEGTARKLLREYERQLDQLDPTPRKP